MAPSGKLQAVTITPTADLSQPPPTWHLRGMKSGRDIKIGDAVTEADGGLVLTVASTHPEVIVSAVFADRIV